MKAVEVNPLGDRWLNPVWKNGVTSAQAENSRTDGLKCILAYPHVGPRLDQWEKNGRDISGLT